MLKNPLSNLTNPEGAAINNLDSVLTQEIDADYPESSFEVLTHKAFTPHLAPTDQPKDYFIEDRGIKFAGRHLIIDLWGASHLDNLTIVENALRDVVTECGATLLHLHLHHFTPNGGISGVAVLAESHISIHSWPERGYAALDVFMCGSCEPAKSLPVLQKAFHPKNIYVNEYKRGSVYEQALV